MLVANVEPGGKRDVFAPQLGFFTQRLPGDCVVNELISSEQFFITKNDEVTALIIINEHESFIAARRTNAFIFFHSISQLGLGSRTTRPKRTSHPHGLRLPRRQFRPRWLVQVLYRLVTGDAWLRHDRTITISWAVTALKRGPSHQPKRNAKKCGGQLHGLNTGTIRLETVGRSRVCNNAFLGDDMANT